LNIIGARVAASGGSVYVNGTPIGGNVKRIMGFVSQQDWLYSTLTVKETIMTHAQLRLPETVSYNEKKTRVDYLIDQLGLTKVADSLVGAKISKGLSGGERKRVNVACELIHDPPILLLDEPTSGLDSTTALEVVKVLRRLAENGHTVICTIHQPRSALFGLFDRLLLLSQGEVFYFGGAKQAVEYFAVKGFPCPSQTNPADFFIDVLSGVNENGSSFNQVAPSEFFDSSKIVSESREVEKGFVAVSDEEEDHHDYVTSFWKQLSVLGVRAWRNEFREPLTSFVAISQTIFMSVIVATLYWNIGLEEPRAVANRTGCLFFLIINSAFSSLSSLRLFLAEREIFSHEKNGRMYRTSAYYLTKCFAELPLRVLNPLLFTLIIYWSTGLDNTFEKFMSLYLVLFLVAYSAASLAVVISATVSNEDVAQILVPVSMTMFLLFGGSSFIAANTIPVYFRWIRYISFMNYGTVAAVVNEFTGLEFTCAADSRIEIPCKDPLSPNPCFTCRIPNGETQLKIMGLDGDSVAHSLGLLLAIALVFRVIAFIGLLVKYKPIIPRNEPRKSLMQN
jgi:ABC-type multidrug transport system ATPase subunit/ABC-type multidrug transport system permease subunit